MATRADQHVERPERAEQRALDDMIRRLRETFPEVPEREIQTVVHGRYTDFDGSPVRDFVPVLVERHAREQLRDRRRAE